jgi:radical SAM superfamily enzyme YgiQ (UPF0313 family)
LQKPLTIYLADLTYDTVTISTEPFPLNVGFVASYCIDQFDANVDVKVFKYIDKLEHAIKETPPDVLGLSNYCWSKNIGKEMFNIFKNSNPFGITVWGGPNFPMDMPSQQEFMDKNSDVDVYVPIDGETGFSNLIEKILKFKNFEDVKKQIFESPIDGCITRNRQGKIHFSIPNIRIKNLDEIPSPYQTGLLDEFFDGKLSPMLQTNRGCPFTCTFCTDGVDAVQQVTKFSLERVKSDLDYISKHVPSNTHTLFVSDLNFGMIPRDLEICDYIDDIKQKTTYPSKVVTTTGKNKKEQIIESIKKLSGSMLLSMSVQSMDEEVLHNIRRDNISVEQMLALAPAIKEANIRTTAEVILGLPGETYQSHLETLRKLVNNRMEDIVVHTCMLLDGSELNTPEQREKWKFKTKFRILPGDFTECNGKKILETEEVIIGSNSLSFTEYIELRKLSFALNVTNRGVVYDPLLKFLREQKVDILELSYQIIKQLQNAPSTIQHVFQQYEKSTIDELWDSTEEIIEFYQNDKEYQKLIDEEAGFNVIKYYYALVTAEHMDDWTKYTIQIAYELLKNSGKLNEDIEKQFNDVSNYCQGISHNPLKKDRLVTNPEFLFAYDIQKWINSEDQLLSQFKFPNSINIAFKLTDEQFKIVEDNLNMYRNTIVGITKAMKVIPVQSLWRQPLIQ